MSDQPQFLSDAFNRINALLDEQREAAYANARMRIAGAPPQPGEEPTPAHYERTAFARHSPNKMRVINIASNIVIVAAFIPSAIRIYAAAYDASLGFSFWAVAALIGICSVMLAETGQIVFTLAASIAESRTQRIALHCAAGACTAFALVGNAQIAQPWIHGYAFAYLETFLPPLLVLVAANIRKTQLLRADEHRYQAHEAYTAAHAEWERTYKDALAQWQHAFDKAHEHVAWNDTLANVLKDALRTANKASKAALRELNAQDWRALVIRERKAEEWWRAAEQEAQAAETQRIAAEQERMQADQDRIAQAEADAAQQRSALTDAVREIESLRLQLEQERTYAVMRSQTQRHTVSGGAGGRTTGETMDAVRANAGGTYTGTCPYCSQEFASETAAGATNALSAHIGRWCKVRKAQQEGEETQPVIAVNGHGG